MSTANINLKKNPTKAPTSVKQASIVLETKALQMELFELQRLLYANQERSLLIILQGLDASGKDSTIRHVFSCINPMGCNVKSFKKPTEEKNLQGFLWRIYPHVPARGMIQIFNRSQYEDILVPTVHGTQPKKIIEQRYDYINSFENHLKTNGTVILKFFLHISEEAQNKKLEQRQKDPRKKWKYDEADTKEKKNRDAYIKVYHKIFHRCSPDIPWEVIPADQKWYKNYLIAKRVVDSLKALNLTYPIR